MAIDRKYGRVEFPDAPWVTIESDEPVFVLRGRDVIAPEVIKEYRKRAVEAGSPQHHLDLIDQSLRAFKQWQQKVSVVPTSNDWLAAQTSDPMHSPNTEPLQTTNDAVIKDVPSSEQRDRLDPTHEWYLTETSTSQDQSTNQTSDEEESYLPGSDAAHYVPPNPNNPQSLDEPTNLQQATTQRIAPGDATKTPSIPTENSTYVQDPLDGLEAKGDM